MSNRILFQPTFGHENEWCVTRKTSQETGNLKKKDKINLNQSIINYFFQISFRSKLESSFYKLKLYDFYLDNVNYSMYLSK